MRGRSDVIDQFNISKEITHECKAGKDGILISPILKWSDADVWNFIRGYNIPYCELYDKGFHRIGCIFCPMASPRVKALQRKMYPGVEREIKKSIQWLIDNRGYMSNHNATADEVFDWWCSNKNAKQYFGMLRNQMKMF